ncbi:MAG: hypothetical protein ACK5OX_01465 [Desertimonas sp.]
MVDSRLAFGVLTLAVLNIPTSSDTTDASTPASPEDTTAASTLVVDGLAQLPASELSDNPLITIADLDAATDANGLQRPTGPDDPDGVQWMMGLTGVGPSGEPAPPVFVPVPRRFSQTFDPAGFADIAGWSILDVDTIAAVDAPPHEFIVVGDDFTADDLSSGLIELADGVVTDRDGDDGMQDLRERGPVDDLGRPVRFATTDGHIALSLSTPAIESWLAGSADTLADDPALLAVGTALDDAGVMSASLTTRAMIGPGPEVLLDPAATPDEIEETIDALSGIALNQLYDALGIGWSVDDSGAPLITLAYHFATADAATESAERLTAIFADGSSARTGAALSESFEMLDASTADHVAVITLGTVDDTPPAIILSMLMSRDLPFMVIPT